MAVAKMSLVTLLAAGCATAAASPQPPSLVLAYWGGIERELPESCPPEDICLNTHAIVRFKNARTLGGPAAPPQFEAAMWFHSVPLPATRVLVRMERKHGAAWEADRVAFVPRSKRMVCVPKEELAELKLKVAKFPGETDQDVCIRV
jgi:hypothetical protein